MKALRLQLGTLQRENEELLKKVVPQHILCISIHHAQHFSLSSNQEEMAHAATKSKESGLLRIKDTLCEELQELKQEIRAKQTAWNNKA